MIIGCVKEIKTSESRVALLPSNVKTLTAMGIRVLIESHAGTGAGFLDEEYRHAGAILCDNRAEIWQKAELIVKVKEPLPEEYIYFRPGLSLFTFLHLAAEKELTEALIKNKVTAIAYETIEENGLLPILKPMSEVAGRMAVQVGSMCLTNRFGGKGLLLSGVPGAKKARVMILGAGVVGKNAAKMAVGLGASVKIFDINASRLEEMDDLFGSGISTLFSDEMSIASEIKEADLVIGAVLVPGARAPTLVSEQMVKTMEQGSAIVDVSVDQGACIETIHRTTHEDPTYTVHGVVHYGVANMPGAVAKTSTIALAHAAFPYLSLLARLGIANALKQNLALKKGLNTHDGMLTHKGVAEFFNKPLVDPASLFG